MNGRHLHSAFDHAILTSALARHEAGEYDDTDMDVILDAARARLRDITPPTDRALISLGRVIEMLRSLPAQAYVAGLGSEIGAYRGHIGRSFIRPQRRRVNAMRLAHELGSQVGERRETFTGDTITVSADEPLHVADNNASLGYALTGFILHPGAGDWEPQLSNGDTAWRPATRTTDPQKEEADVIRAA